MSRRESRTSTCTRPNDALFEYEALKKKFLHANKAITKLNSTLSIRIEELNAELSTLYAENLRLRSSEIRLTAQLRRERERSRKLLADTEAAASHLTKRLESLRQSYKIDISPPTPPSPPSPKARRPPPTTKMDAQIGRLSRPPNIPEIHEEDEPIVSSSDSDSGKSSLCRSRLTSESRFPTVQISRRARPSPPLQDLNISTHRKKPSRRQSGHVNKESLAVPRPSSPAFGSPIRKAAALAQEDDEIDEDEDINNLDEDKERRGGKVDRQRREAKTADKGILEDAPAIARSTNIRSSKERKRPRVDDEPNQNEAEPKQLSRFALQPIDNRVQDQGDANKNGTKTTLTSNITPSRAPAIVASSSTSTNVEPEGASLTSRERRARKSVNYAEPKLNTKMRKPDPLPVSDPTSHKKRSSAAAIMTTTIYKYRDPDTKEIDDDKVLSNRQLSIDCNPIQTVTTLTTTAPLVKKKSQPRLPTDDEDGSDGAEADEEYMPPGRVNWINFEGRKRMNTSRRITSTIFGSSADAGVDTRRHSMAV
ncbi:hypothetical protein APHAL10511_007189 [Amanita phalloides]|nr:hypothetical protein APHAL10511_007189 [Amanita phalloides]